MSLLLLTIIIVLFCVGLFGSFVPAIPGIGLVYLGILIYAVTNKFADISLSATIVFGLVTLLASATQYIGSVFGVKKSGGGATSIMGALAGAFIGIAAGPSGLFIGAFLGALVGALLEGHAADKAIKVAAMSVIGIIGGSAVQFLFSLFLIFAFLLTILL